MASEPSEPLIGDPTLFEVKSSNLPDIYVQLLFYVFTGNLLFGFVAIMIGTIPYYDYHLVYVQTLHGLIGAAIAAGLFYVLLFAGAWYGGPRIILGAAFPLVVAIGLLAGFASKLAGDLIFLQFLVISCVQSFAVIIYTRISPRAIALVPVWLFMILATVAVWCIFIYAFVVQLDWLSGGILLGVAFLLSLYNVFYIHRGKLRYDASWRSGVTAFARYYCEVPLFLCKK